MPQPHSGNGVRTLALLALPAIAALAAYFGVHEFGFVFDDDGALVHNRALREGDWWAAAFGDYNSLSNRPLACFSLALDLRLGLGPGGMHVVSLAIHCLNASLVALVLSALGGSAVVAGLGATIWAVHPLGVDAVAYLTQRSMLWMGCFSLFAFLALLRSHGSPRAARWRAATVVAAALALASKEEAAALPILLVLADRAFGARPRPGFYGALAATWLVLIACVSLGPHNPTVGYATVPPATAWEWLLTQTRCLSHYVRSVFVPTDLRGMYDFAVIRTLGPAVLPGLLLIAGLVATVYVYLRWPRLGFCGAVFFLLLAPTSTIFPIITEACADRRMYLPLLAFVAPLALAAGRRLPSGAFVGLAALIAAPLLWQTRATAAHYRDMHAFVPHAYQSNELTNKSFLAGKILAAMAKVEHERGNTATSHRLAERAMECEAPGRAERLQLANVRREQGRDDEAERIFRSILALYPDYASAMGNLAQMLHERSTSPGEPRARELVGEAEALLVRALDIEPHHAINHNSYGVLLYSTNRTERATGHLERAVALDPNLYPARLNLGIAYLQLDRPRETLQVLAPLVAANPNDPSLAGLVAEARARLKQ